MENQDERTRLESIEYHLLTGEVKKALKEKEEFLKQRNQPPEEPRRINMQLRKRSVKLEGIVTPAGWDQWDNISKSCLYTPDGEDIILEHEDGMLKFRSFLNERVEIKVRFYAMMDLKKKLQVKKINRIWKHLRRAENHIRNHYLQDSSPAA